MSISLKHFSVKDKILTGVLSVGISASIANLLSSVTSIFVNSQLSGYDGGDMLVAGYGRCNAGTFIHGYPPGGYFCSSSSDHEGLDWCRWTDLGSADNRCSFFDYCAAYVEKQDTEN